MLGARRAMGVTSVEVQDNGTIVRRIMIDPGQLTRTGAAGRTVARWWRRQGVRDWRFRRAFGWGRCPRCRTWNRPPPPPCTGCGWGIIEG